MSEKSFKSLFIKENKKREIRRKQQWPVRRQRLRDRDMRRPELKSQATPVSSNCRNKAEGSERITLLWKSHREGELQQDQFVCFYLIGAHVWTVAVGCKV